MNNRRDEIERIIREGFADDSDHVVAMETVSELSARTIALEIWERLAGFFPPVYSPFGGTCPPSVIAAADAIMDMARARAALEAVSSIHEAEPVAWRADHEVDGGYTRKYTSSEWEAYQWNEAGLNVEGLALIDPFASDREADLADMGAYIRQRDDAVADLELAEARLRNLQQKAQEQGVADGNMLNRIHPLHGDTRERPAPISKGVTVKALVWDGDVSTRPAPAWYFLNEVEGKGWRYHYGSAAPYFPSKEEARAAAQINFADGVKSCLSHTAGEIE